MVKYEDTKEGAIKCLKETTQDDIVEFILQRLNSEEFMMVMDPEHKNVWAIRGDYQTLAIIYLADEDVEVGDRLLDLMQ